jgi:hypothetical protein
MWHRCANANKTATDDGVNGWFDIEKVNSITSVFGRVLCLGLMVVTTNIAAAKPGDIWQTEILKTAQFENESASPEARLVANWVVDSSNNGGLPFVILDKRQAKLFVFYADGRLRGASAALIGLAVGDHSVPGIGQRKLSAIRPEERTTPAGRFVAALDRNLKGHEILWVDYDAAISLHPVITSNAKERRAQRLASPSPLDKRISYGCINVPADFFYQVISAAFAGTNGIVYVLPETVPVKAFFGAYDFDAAGQ